ncbi:HlyD family efflux transporter periplasmic adaptor subunit [Pseudomonas edaphica]|uniref:HlyD family efflux transporter periplasmic adaptor subunit n=1 Tax=Pseudomonas edaphica TaxID=2006980 RepID=A0ABY2U8L1_9PSED|nr:MULTISPECIES: HlyD family efflux transporter periplasmic adaptor subunit [Pseudomonas]MCF5233159.1 HlyD family efflux transporter periplasmic adaptor subunit [Pseudomonas sp. PA-5-4H]MCF5236551.1 HlyD family efflux transporter periplasmic adaptor subunit [Pseudomonas sp. PA-5-4G]MCF5251346.1 HlyD family efflux transporter periplasmic adaptor subunit [Pseudomonas sp. PA-5-4B]MCF5254481.1 HlyD family efflux transporter periplasmic adaptor subunit [Pseudomonas sp. PA-5-4B]MCF5262220.1 HlyD fam
MNVRSLSPWLTLFSACLLLNGCSREDTPAQATASSPTYLAVARGRVDVEGGLLNLQFARDGVVAEIKVKEGDSVKKGQLLASLDSEQARLAVSAALADQQQAQVHARHLQRQFNFADQKATRLSKAAAAGAADGQSADDAREAAEQLRDAIEKNQGHLEAATRTLTGARYELTQRNLYAPADAEVVRRLTQPGATVSSESGPAFVLLPNEVRIVRAELNESFIAQVHAGMKAEISTENGNDQPSLSGHVVRISSVLGNSTLEGDPQARANMRTVECIVAFEQPAPASLRVGQRMLVRFGAP